MPSIHISEAVFSEYVDREGGYQEAKDAIKKEVRRGLKEKLDNGEGVTGDVVWELEKSENEMDTYEEFFAKSGHTYKVVKVE